MIEIRLAGPEDNAGLLELTRRCPMEGKVRLLIDRQPDFFALVRLRGESEVLVALDKGRHVGVIGVTYRDLYLNGKPLRGAYLNDFKVDPNYRNTTVALRLMAGIQQRVALTRAAFAYLVTPAGNRPLIRTLSGRAGIPAFRHLGDFSVYEIQPRPCKEDPRALRLDPEHAATAIAAFDAQQARYQLGQVLQPEAFRAYLGHEAVTTYGITGAKGVEALVTTIDTAYCKQNVITKMPPLTAAGVAVQRLLSRFLPLAPLPKVGEPLRMLYVSQWMLPEGAGRAPAMRRLLRALSAQCYAEKMTFLSIGVHASDPLHETVRKFPAFEFESSLYFTYLDQELLSSLAIDSGLPLLHDYAIV